MKAVTFDETKWQLVPKVPTDAMKYAPDRYRPYANGLMYRSMLAAPPQHPEAGQLTDADVADIFNKDIILISVFSCFASNLTAAARRIERRIREGK